MEDITRAYMDDQVYQYHPTDRLSTVLEWHIPYELLHSVQLLYNNAFPVALDNLEILGFPVVVILGGVGRPVLVRSRL